MSDLITIAKERRALVAAELEKLDDFIALAQALVEGSEGRRGLPGGRIGWPETELVVAEGERTEDFMIDDIRIGSPANMPAEHHGLRAAIDSYVEALRGRIEGAVSARRVGRAIDFGNDETGMADPGIDVIGAAGRWLDARIRAGQAGPALRGHVARLISAVEDSGTRAFRRDDTATTLPDPAALAVIRARVAAALGAALVEPPVEASGVQEPVRADAVDTHVGQRLRQRRWMTGVTQQQLGEMARMRHDAVRDCEAGAAAVTAGELWRLAAALEVPVAFFFEGLDGQAEDTGEARGDMLSDAEALDLVRAYYDIPEDQRRRLFDLARVLREAA